jgi:hypothetical protein
MFFGTSLQHKLEEAGHKPSKEERKTVAARQRVLDKVFGPKQAEGKRFADPMSLI